MQWNRTENEKLKFPLCSFDCIQHKLEHNKRHINTVHISIMLMPSFLAILASFPIGCILPPVYSGRFKSCQSTTRTGLQQSMLPLSIIYSSTASPHHAPACSSPCCRSTPRTALQQSMLPVHTTHRPTAVHAASPHHAPPYSSPCCPCP